MAIASLARLVRIPSAELIRDGAQVPMVWYYGSLRYKPLGGISTGGHARVNFGILRVYVDTYLIAQKHP